MSDFACHKCQHNFSLALASCGSGTTWSLYTCPHCNQQYTTGLVPVQAQNAETIFLSRAVNPGEHVMPIKI